jgi:hypothetical protein
MADPITITVQLPEPAGRQLDGVEHNAYPAVQS